MTSQRLFARLSREDDGVALILALAMITIISVGLLALGTMADTNLKVTTQLRTAANTSVAADAALKQVVTQIAADTGSPPTLGVDTSPGGVGSNCSVANYTIPPGTYGNAQSVNVRCQAKAGSGQPTTGTGPAPNVPDFAVLASGVDHNEPGIRIAGNGLMRIGGDIYANSDTSGAITGSPGTTLSAVDASVNPPVTYTIGTRGTCTGGATYVPACSENLSTQQGLSYDTDTKWQRKTLPTNVIDPASIPTSCAAGAAPNATLGPGYYDNVQALNTLFSSASCANKVIQFTSGVYYFEFKDTATAHQLQLSTANVHVIGGQLTATPTVVGSACRTDTSVPAATNGVQWIFGGDSRVSVTAGHLELCPIPDANNQEIAVFGLRHDAGGATNTFTGHPGGPAATNDVDSTDSCATNCATYGSSSPGGFNLSGYDFSSIPSTATITSVQIRTGYKADAGVKNLSLTVTSGGQSVNYTDANGNSCPATKLCIDNAYHLQTLSGPAVTTPAQLAGTTVSFQATMNHNASGNLSLDGVNIIVNYTTLTYSAQGGCVTTSLAAGSQYTVNSSPACPFLFADGSQSFLQLHGTYYAWSAGLHLNLPNQTLVALARGGVGRVFDLNVPASLVSTEAIISLPHNLLTGNPHCRNVVLTATSGSATIRAEVWINDAGCAEHDSSLANGAVVVKHWSVVS